MVNYGIPYLLRTFRTPPPMAKVELQKVDARNKLKPRREPYWHRLEAGHFLGFRKMTAVSVGTWSVRSRDSATGEQSYHPLGEFEHLAPSERFDAARKAAMAWLGHLAKGGRTEVVDVRRACEGYVKHVRGSKGDAPADDLQARFARHVDDDPIARIELGKLNREHVREWRRRLEAKPKGTSAKNPEQSLGARSAGTLNRDMTALRAALNHALSDGLVTSDFAWAEPLKPIRNADGRRTLYLDLQQRRALIEKAAPDVAKLLRGLALLPLRPGALAELNAGHFDKRLRVLTVGKDKAGQDRRLSLPKSTADFLAEMVDGKLPAAPLFTRADGGRWDKDAWKGPIKEAAALAELPPETTAYTLRHSTITDLVVGGLDLLTVAQLSGTGVTMIEKHYGHLRREHAAAALAGLAL